MTQEGSYIKSKEGKIEVRQANPQKTMEVLQFIASSISREPLICCCIVMLMERWRKNRILTTNEDPRQDLTQYSWEDMLALEVDKDRQIPGFS